MAARRCPASTCAARTRRWSSAGRGVGVKLTYADVTGGTGIPPVSYPVSRLSLIKYAGASGDFNVIHWNERIARSVGLPDVIAHGMFPMAQARPVVTGRAGPFRPWLEFRLRV